MCQCRVPICKEELSTDGIFKTQQYATYGGGNDKFMKRLGGRRRRKEGGVKLAIDGTRMINSFPPQGNILYKLHFGE